MKKNSKTPNPLVPFPRKPFDTVGKKVEIAREAAARSSLKIGKKIGDAPSYLGEVGRACWVDVVGKLRQMGLEDKADEMSVEAFCAAYEEYRETRDVIDQKGYTYTTLSDRGGFRELKRPEVEIMQSAWSRMRGLLPELCMTPLSRLRAMPPDKDAKPTDDPMAEFLAK